MTISKTTVWKKCACPGNFAHAETFPPRHAGAIRLKGLLLPTPTTGDEWMRIAQVAPLTEAVPPKLYGGALADRGTGRTRKRRHAICQRRFQDLGETRCNMAEGAAPRRIGSRSQCVTHGDAGTRPAEM